MFAACADKRISTRTTFPKSVAIVLVHIATVKTGRTTGTVGTQEPAVKNSTHVFASFPTATNPPTSSVHPQWAGQLTLNVCNKLAKAASHRRGSWRFSLCSSQLCESCAAFSERVTDLSAFHALFFFKNFAQVDQAFQIFHQLGVQLPGGDVSCSKDLSEIGELLLECHWTL